MQPLLETPRLIIRHFEPEDWEAVLSYASLPDVMRYLPEEPFDEQAARRFVNVLVEKRLLLKEEPGYLAAVHKSSGNIIGNVAFYSFHGVPLNYELGYVFHPDYHGQGLASEACYVILRYAFEERNLHRMVATCDPRNTASVRLLERLGMRREAHFVKCLYLKGEWVDEYFYALLAEEWPKAKITLQSKLGNFDC
jgi:[ribosomal protein S5]-alanine N-acetyltransferase